MRVLQITILTILISCQFATGQEIKSSLIGRLLITSDFEFIELISDSLIYSSINNFSDTSEFDIIGSDLIIKERVYEPNSARGYKIRRFKYFVDKQTDNSLSIISPNNFRLDFFDIKTLNNEIFDFTSIELEYLTPWDNSRLIRIDSSGNYYDKITYLPLKSRRFKRKHKTIKYTLSDTEKNNLKQNLSDFYAIYLPTDRSCPIDGVTSNFVIKTNGQTFYSKGCDISWLHNKLLDYLLNIKESKD
jgi:hypothetical protein